MSRRLGGSGLSGRRLTPTSTYLDATYPMKVRWGASVTSMALLACVGVDEEGFREVVLAVVGGGGGGGGRLGEGRRLRLSSLLRGLIDRGLWGVRLVISDDHEGIKAAVFGEELPGGAGWQRCVVHFERNVLFSHVAASSMGEVAEDLKAIFKVRREKTASALAEEFVELYGGRFPKAVFPCTRRG